MEWFYSAKGQRSGPVTEDDLKSLQAKGQLFPDSLVWNSSFGNDWKRLDAVDELKVTNLTSPPPLPTSAINDGWIWVIAFSPIIIGALDIWSQVATGGGLDVGTISIINIIICFTCIAMDNGVVARAGSGKRIIGVAPWVLLTPAPYLFVRAKRLKKNLAPMLTWIACFALTVFLTTNVF